MNNIYEEIKQILIKKAEGFFYNETVLEYSLDDSSKKNKLKGLELSQQPSIQTTFDDYQCMISKDNYQHNSPKDDYQHNIPINNNQYNLSNYGSPSPQFTDDIVQLNIDEQTCQQAQQNKSNSSNQTTTSAYFDNTTDNVNSEDNEEKDKYILTKRKVSSHYVPPDILAIKMLLEMYNNESNGKQDLTKLTDKELNKLRKELITKLKENE